MNCKDMTWKLADGEERALRKAPRAGCSSLPGLILTEVMGKRGVLMFAEAFKVPETTAQVKLCLQAFAFILICL